MAKVDWIDINESMPDEAGMHLTYWSDGTLETYPVCEKEIAKGYISSGNDVVLFWAENVDPPEGFDT